MSSLTARTSSRSPSPSADVDARQGSPVPSALAAANAGAASAGAGAGAYRSRLAGQLGFGRAEPGHAARPGLRGIRASSNESLETGRGHQRLPSRSSLLGMSGGSGAGAGQDHHPEGVSHEPYLGSGADALRRSRKRATPSPPPSLVGVPSSSTTAAHGTPDPDYPYEPEQSPRAASALATSHPSAYARSEYLADPRRRISDEIAPAHPQEPVSGLRRVSDEHLGAGAGTKRSSPDAYHREFPSSESANALSSPPPLPSREGHGQEDAMPPPLVRSYHTPAMTGSRMLHSAHTAGKSVGGVPRSAGRSIRKLGEFTSELSVLLFPLRKGSQLSRSTGTCVDISFLSDSRPIIRHAHPRAPCPSLPRRRRR